MAENEAERQAGEAARKRNGGFVRVMKSILRSLNRMLHPLFNCIPCRGRQPWVQQRNGVGCCRMSPLAYPECRC